MEKESRHALPRLQDILFLSVFAAAVLLGPRMLNGDGDLPRHLAIGKYVLAGHLPPLNDIFSYTRFGTPFAPHKWLAGVFFYLSYLLFDERGIVLLSAFLLAAAFTVIYRDAARRTGLRLVLLGLVLACAAVSSLHWLARPHLFTMLFLAIWLTWSERLASGQRMPLWYFPVLMLVWNNTHAEFIAGFLVVLACLGGWAWDYAFKIPGADVATGRRLGIVLLLIAAVTLINPVSVRALGTVTGWMGNAFLMERTQETASPDFLKPDFVVLLAFLAASVFLLAMKRGKLPTRMALLLAGFTALTLQSARNVHLYGVVAAFVLPGTLEGALSVAVVSRYERLVAAIDRRAYGVVWPAAVVAVGAAALAVLPVGRMEHFSPSAFPMQAVEWLKTHPQDGNMFNTFDWGGYLSLTVWPERRVFVDSQGDVYGEAFMREYDRVASVAPDWRDVMDKYDVRWALIPPTWRLAAALEGDGWRETYRDDTAVILVREH